MNQLSRPVAPSNQFNSRSETVLETAARCGAPVLARRIAEETEEVRIRREQHVRIAFLQSLLVGLHRSIEREEVRVPTIGFRENAVALGVAFAAGALAGRSRLGNKHGHVAIGLGAD